MQVTADDEKEAAMRLALRNENLTGIRPVKLTVGTQKIAVFLFKLGNQTDGGKMGADEFFGHAPA